jgi:hypothetical protein
LSSMDLFLHTVSNKTSTWSKASYPLMTFMQLDFVIQIQLLWFSLVIQIQSFCFSLVRLA